MHNSYQPMRLISTSVILAALAIIHRSIERKILDTNTQTVDRLDKLHTQAQKVSTEVQNLKDVIANQGNTPPEVTAALDRVERAMQGLDDLNTDAATPPAPAPAPAPAPTPTPPTPTP